MKLNVFRVCKVDINKGKVQLLNNTTAALINIHILTYFLFLFLTLFFSYLLSRTSQTTCLSCQPGQHQDEIGQSYCKKCPKDYFTYNSGRKQCILCIKGRYTLYGGQSSCVSCAAGRYGESLPSGGNKCQQCPTGWKRAEEDYNLLECIQCILGETTTITGATSCSGCGIGTYGAVPGECSQCSFGQYQSEKKQITCHTCTGGKLPNEQATGCVKPSYITAEDCDIVKQFLNDSSTDPNEHHCLSCPKGASCYGNIGWNGVIALQGWWRIPWSEGKNTFERCPYSNDCIGSQSPTAATDVNITESCLPGTSGPLCSICIEGYNRDGGTCHICNDGSVPMRAGILVTIVLLICVVVMLCRRKVRKKWQIYSSLWRDFLRVISINITFAQINSSLPHVLEIQWPPEWRRFVEKFAFVNIDFLSLIGISCIGDYNYYISFLIIVCLPVSILILAIVNYHCAKTSMQRKLRILTDKEKTNMEEEALHSLFHLADADHSGEVDSAELAGILRALSWKVTVPLAHTLVEKIAREPNEQGLYLLSEDQFLQSMLSGKMKELFEDMDESVAIVSRKSSTKRMSLLASKLNKKPNMLSNRQQLIEWTVRKNLVANSLSGATQLLLLSHTPVSRKTFQYFDCNEIAGRNLLRADYDVDCGSEEYLTFMPAVFIVLIGFIIALPGFISFYLFRHRKELYSTSVYQTIGWLYDPFVRGAEFWQVHDVMMKMVLTGMLIYVPSTSRAGIAILVCVIAVANLNYFRPHKNQLLFVLVQISFVTTTAKYVVALLLSVDTKDENEQFVIGTLLITLDIVFMASSLIAIIASIYVLHARIKQLQREDKEKKRDADVSTVHDNKTRVVPIDASGNVLVEKNDDTDDEEENDNEIYETTQSNQERFERPRSELSHSRSTILTADALHKEFHIHELALKASNAEKQKKQRRQTQNRVMARFKIRKTKALSKVPMFKKIPQESIESILECTTYERHLKDAVLCTFGELATEFYIIVSGSCAVSVGDVSTNNYRRVGTLKELDFFGENALLEGEGKRNATVIAAEVVQVLLLSRENFEMLVESGALSEEVVSTVKKERERREKLTRESMSAAVSLEPTQVPTPPPPQKIVTQTEI